jgi:hypothetical protein
MTARVERTSEEYALGFVAAAEGKSFDGETLE